MLPAKITLPNDRHCHNITIECYKTEEDSPVTRLLKLFLYVIATLLIIVLVLVKPVDDTPYQEKDYYRKTLAQLGSDSLVKFAVSHKDTLRAGWAAANITPQKPAHLMGYGYKGDYTHVHDSVFVRTVVFSKGGKKVAFISYDFMMVHPALAAAVRQATELLGIDYFYFTAIHTHHSYGGWATGLGGQMIAGIYNEDLVQYIATQTKKSIQTAINSMEPVDMDYQAYALPALVANRLVANGAVDSLLRVVSLRKKSGKTGLICTFAAHATYTDAKLKGLSADYPGAFVRALEADTAIDFALFAAGAVGSHAPVREGTFADEKLAHFAQQLAAPVLANVSKPHTGNTQGVFLFASLPVALGEPQFKINERWRLRPWLFDAVFGKLSPQITLLQIGDIIFLGFPGDFSGMLYPRLQVPKNMHTIVTSFDGSYVGYIVPDAYYHNDNQEAKETNWFGPYTGSYFIEITNRFVQAVQP